MRQVIGWGIVAGWVLCGSVWAADPPSHALTPKIRSQVFEIAYQVKEDSLPLTSISLWYTIDRGAAWRHYGRDEDAQSPISFHAPQEGLYGFYIVAANEHGLSGKNPDANTSPQQWTFVDFTPPIVQVNAADLDLSNPAAPAVILRWAALDSQLPARPVELAFRGVPAGDWTTIARDVANTGRYDWRTPAGLTGTIEFRMTVRDLGGHAIEAVSPPLDLGQHEWESDSHGIQSGPPISATSTAEGVPAPHLAADRTGIQHADIARVNKLSERASWHARRGEYRLAVARYRDALKIDSASDAALVGLGDVLYALGDLEPSTEAYQLLLRRDPVHPAALDGLARVFVAQKNYPKAAEHLGRLLKQSPHNVAAWLELGDVTMMLGDQLSAMDFYERAATLDSTDEEIVAAARHRLAELQAGPASTAKVARQP